MALFGKLFKKEQEIEKAVVAETVPSPEPVVLKPVLFNLNDTLRDVANILSMDAQEKGISILYRMKKDVPSKVIGDRYKLSRLLTDLIGNAIDFTDKRQDVVVQISRNEKNDESVELHFEVIDYGVGISDELVESMLMPMLSGDQAAQAYGISGSGLQRARDIVHAMQGSIMMESEPKKGTKVSFYVVLSSPDLKERRHYHLPDKKGVGLKTLVVDDDMGSAKAVVPILEYFLHKVTLGKPSELTKMQEYDLVMISSAFWTESLQESVVALGENRPKVVMIESLIKHHPVDEKALSFVDWLIYKPFTQQFVYEMLMALYSDALKHVSEIENIVEEGDKQSVPDGVSRLSECVEAFLNGIPLEQTSASRKDGICYCCKYAHQFFVATDGLERSGNDYAAYVDKLKEVIWKYMKADRVISAKIDQGEMDEAAAFMEQMKRVLVDLGIYKLACLTDLLQTACQEGRVKDIEALRNIFTYVLTHSIDAMDQFIDQAKYKIR